MYFFFAGDLGAGAPGALLSIDALVTEQIGTTGILNFTHSRSVTDLCAVLAGLSSREE